MKKLLFVFQLFSCLLPILSEAQTIQIKGQVLDDTDVRIPVSACIVVNMRTQQGMLADENGKFSINIYPTDTIAFRNIGYGLKFIRLKDSLITPGFNLIVQLKKQSYLVREIVIIPQRGLDSISKDIQKLGYDEGKYMLQGIDALQSPITALYQLFSRRENSRREVAFMINEDERKKLLRELLHFYNTAGYIDLDADRYDRFINFCGINDAQLKTLTQYEMAVYIKRKLEIFNTTRN